VARAIDDQWAAGDAYEAYMGRWSRLVAMEFVQWLKAEPGGAWLEVGCGSGALTASICQVGEPGSVVACDQSAPFVEYMRTHVRDPRVTGVAATTDALPARTGGFDVVVSGLVLNFIPEPTVALAAMRDRVREDGVVAAYVWDYSGGIEMLARFWDAAVAQDPGAGGLDESRRFEAWHPRYVASLFERAGLEEVAHSVLSVPTPFANFDDYWAPFLGGTGPAPTYVASLTPSRRDELQERVRAGLPTASDGSIRLHARAVAVRGIKPSGR